MLRLESWLSGLRRTTGNRVWANTPPRVQIPNSPPVFAVTGTRQASVGNLPSCGFNHSGRQVFCGFCGQKYTMARVLSTIVRAD